MKCTVVGQHLRILTKSVRLMSKYSEHVTILVKDSGLVFQAVNDSKSAFCEVIFAKQFFATYSFSGSFECRVDIKSLILVFRIINLDRIVESCKIVMDSSLPKIVFEMKCKYGVFREYYIPYMDGDIIKCSRVSDKSLPSIKAAAKMFAEIFKHFAHSTREASVWLYDNHMRFKTFIETDDQDYFNLPSTSFSYVSREFTLYNYTEDLVATFNVRDIKAFLDFASFQNQLVSAYFQPDSKPIEFMFNNNADNYSARIIMATIEFAESEQPVPPPFAGGSTRSSLANSSRSNVTSANESLVYSVTNTTVSSGEHRNSADAQVIREPTENPQKAHDSAQVENNSEEESKESQPEVSDESQPEDNNPIALHSPGSIPPTPPSCSEEENEENIFDDIDTNQVGDQPLVSKSSSPIPSTSRNIIETECSQQLRSKNQTATFSSGTTNQEDDEILEDEIDNIVDILDHLPDFSQSAIPLSGTQLAKFHHNLFPDESSQPTDRRRDGLVIPDSDED